MGTVTHPTKQAKEGTRGPTKDILENSNLHAHFEYIGYSKKPTKAQLD
jgi:hypothetical protein